MYLIIQCIVCASRPPPRPIGDLRRGGTHRPHLRRKVLFCLEGQATNVEIEARKLALSMVERLQRESFELPERLLDLQGALLDMLIASSTHLWCSGGVSERSRIARGGSGKLSSTLRGGAGRPETAILELMMTLAMEMLCLAVIRHPKSSQNGCRAAHISQCCGWQAVDSGIWAL